MLYSVANWLQNIAGQNAGMGSPVIKKSESVDAIVRDLRSMQDDETRGGAQSSRPRHERKGGRNSARHASGRVQHRPAPKAVVHKEPTRAKKRKEKVKSNRSGSKGKGFMA